MTPNNKELSKQIEHLAMIVEKMTPAIAPIPAIPAIPAIPPINNSGDHDLLQRIDTKVDRVIVDVSNIDKNYSARIENLEKFKVDKVELEEHKKGNDEIITKLMTTKDGQTILISIGIGLIVLLTSIIIYHLFQIKV